MNEVAQQFPITIAVTGGNGFVGRAIVDHLIAQASEGGDINLRLLTRRNRKDVESAVTPFVGDLLDPAFPAHKFLEGVDILVNCAGELHNETKMQALHVEATRRLIAAAPPSLCRWVQMSSVGAYGQVRTGSVNESQPENPLGPYETTKTEADRLIRKAAKQSGLEEGFDAILLRPAIVIGPSMPNQSVFQMIRAVARGRFFHISSTNVVELPSMSNYVDVEAVAKASVAACFVRIGENEAERRHRTYILAQPAPMSDIIKTICEALGRAPISLRFPLSFARTMAQIGRFIPGFPLTPRRVEALSTSVIYNSERAEKELGFAYGYEITDTIKSLVAAHADH